MQPKLRVATPGQVCPRQQKPRGRVWSFPLASLLGIFLMLSTFLPCSYQFGVSKAPLHFHLERTLPVIKLWLSSGGRTAVCVHTVCWGPPEGRAVADVGCVCNGPCTCVLQVLDVTLRRSGSQINVNSGARWAEEGGGFADCGDC